MAKKTIGKEKYIIGIDSGATSSEVLIYKIPVSETRPRLLKRKFIESEKKGIYKKYSPVNYNVLGYDESVKRLVNIINDSAKETGFKNILYIIAGVSGARNAKDRLNLQKTIAKEIKFKKIKILPDTEIAFYSVFTHNQTNCGILIAGTGSIFYYKDSQGFMKRIGGWGRILGDEGSGYWIAKEALSICVRNFDNSKRSLNLSAMLKEKFGLHETNIIEEIYHKNFEIPKITREVFRLAENGDFISIEIIKRAAEHFAVNLERIGKIDFTIALFGSLFTEEKLLEKYLRKIADKKYPNINLIKTNRKPVWGAVEIGRALVTGE